MKIWGILFISILGHLTSPAQNKWELQKEEKDLKIYTRSVSGQDIKAFKLITTIAFEKTIVLAALSDNNHKPEWQSDCLKAEFISKSDNKESWKMTVDFPWPMDDKVVINDQWIEQNGDTTIIRFQTNTALQNDPNISYIKNVSGYFKLLSQDKNTLLIYESLADPGMSIPAWVINMKLVDSPYNMRKELITYLKRQSSN